MNGTEYTEQSEEFARELFSRQREFSNVVRDSADHDLLYHLAVDLGSVLLGLARDPRLKALLGGAQPPLDLERKWAEVLLVDWAHLLDRFGYEPPPPAEDRADDVRSSILEFSREPRTDTYIRLVHYLTDMGNRLIEADRPETDGKVRRLRRRVSRGLWVLGRISLAATVGATVAALSVSGVGAVTAAGIAVAAGPEVARAVVEHVLPQRLGSSDADEDIDLQNRAGRLNDLLAGGRIGQLKANLDLETRMAEQSVEISVRFSTDVLLWASLVQGSVLAVRDLASASNSELPWSCDRLSSALIDLRSAVRSKVSADQISSIFSSIEQLSYEVSQGLADNQYLPHP